MASIPPSDIPLTLQEAADLLNVSKTFLLALLSAGEIASINTGPDQRLLFSDVIRYKTEIDANRRKVLDELVTESEKLNNPD